MRFEDVALENALGWSLAHSVQAGTRKLAKGTVLGESHLAALRAAGISSIHGFRLDEDDMGEDEAALAAATHLAGPGVRTGRPTRGRCNLHAEADGLLLASEGIDAFNATDEALTIATLPDHSLVRAGQLVATVKVIPYALPKDRFTAALGSHGALARAPFTGFNAHFLVSGSELSGKTRGLTEARIASVGGEMASYTQCHHTVSGMRDALETLSAAPGELVLMLGPSAISDRRDILPAALVEAGGEVIQLGMPVDPGNLLMLGRLGDKTVLGLPGCARSPALNGLDWVLERFAARLPLDAGTIRRMGIGGLLKETVHRPEPRAPRDEAPLRVQAVILAARSEEHTSELQSQ